VEEGTTRHVSEARPDFTADATLQEEDRLGDDRASGRLPRRHAALSPTVVERGTGALADRR
jgi:hypothetical protein